MKKGLTVIELLIVVGILAILLTLGTVVFSSFARKDQLLVQAKEIESILNEARMKTMAGFSLGGDEAFNFGVYFQTDRYILFPGSTYDSQNANNQEFILPTTVEIKSISLPSESIVFEKITGEVMGFDPQQNNFILNDKRSQEEKKMSINQLGTVKIEDL